MKAEAGMNYGRSQARLDAPNQSPSCLQSLLQLAEDLVGLL
jgi:hypothetical protein